MTYGLPIDKDLPVTSRQSGSATVEFTLAASILAPMLVLMPSLAKTTDMNLATTQAARYGAWEQTVQHKSGDELATELSKRFYGKSELGITSKQGALTGDEMQNAFWTGTGLNQRMFTSGEDTVAVSVNESGLGGVAGQVERVVSRLGGIVGGTNWDLGGDGVFTVTVGVDVENDHFGSDEAPGQNCGGASQEGMQCMRFKSAILTDTWSASGPEHVRERVLALVPASHLESVGDTVSNIGKALPLFQELADLEGMFGHVEADVLPGDRYGKPGE